jgi:hypothetical protein
VGSTATNFWQGTVSALVIVSGNLSVADVNNMYDWVARRLGY